MIELIFNLIILINFCAILKILLILGFYGNDFVILDQLYNNFIAYRSNLRIILYLI